MVTEFSYGKIKVDQNTDSWQKVTRFLDVDELTASLSYWAERGSIKRGAQVSSIARQINNEPFSHYMLKVKDKDLLQMSGVKMFALWLLSGEEGMRGYIADVKASGEASGKLVKYLDKLEKNYAANAATLADRKGVIESLACLVPPQGTDEEGCRAFYERRRAAEKVFPIKWLYAN